DGGLGRSAVRNLDARLPRPRAVRRNRAHRAARLCARGTPLSGPERAARADPAGPRNGEENHLQAVRFVLYYTSDFFTQLFRSADQGASPARGRSPALACDAGESKTERWNFPC